MDDTSIQPIAVLAGASDFKNSDDFDLSGSTYKEKGRSQPLEGDFKAGGVTKVGEQKNEIMGLALFDRGKMVGEIDGEETTYHLMAEGEFGYSYLTFPDPLKQGHYVLLNVKQSRKPKKKVEMVDSKPKIDVKIILEADILSIQSGINYEDPKNIGVLERAAEEFLKEGALRYLNKTSGEFGVDICGFGKLMKSKFLTWDQWVDFGWLKKYKDATFDVNVDLKIRRPGLMLRTVSEEGTQGEGNN
jgi:spore germination protein KC